MKPKPPGDNWIGRFIPNLKTLKTKENTMTFLNIKTVLASAIVASGLTIAAAPAQAGCWSASDPIGCWLQGNAGSKDFVGEWLRDTFGGIQNNGHDFDTPNVKLDGYKQAVEIMAKWPRTKGKNDGERAAVNQVCSGEKLLHVILETKSPEKTTAMCFVKVK